MRREAPGKSADLQGAALRLCAFWFGVVSAKQSRLPLLAFLFSPLRSPSCADGLSFRQKIRTRYLATPDKSATLESLMEHEKTEKKKTATEGLLWLIRCVPPRSLILALTGWHADALGPPSARPSLVRDAVA